MNKLFWILSLSRWTSEFGDWFSYLVQIVIIDDYKNISIMIAIQSIIPFIFTGLIGNFVEKNDKIRIICGTEILLVLSNILLYMAYYYDKLWYLVYVYVFIKSICASIKTSAYQSIIPLIVEKEKIEEATTIHSIVQSIVYVLAIVIGGTILNFYGGIINLSIDTASFVVSIIAIFWFNHHFSNFNKFEIYNELDEESQTEISFKNGLNYVISNSKFMIILIINAIVYFIFGIIEIINFQLGLDEYGILMFCLVLGFSTCSVISLYFLKTDHYIRNYVILIISLIMYVIIERHRIVSLWFVGLTLFSYTHYAYWIMIGTIIQRDANKNYIARVNAYNNGLTSLGYAAGSFVGSYTEPWYVTWIIIGVTVIIMGICLIKYKKLNN